MLRYMSVSISSLSRKLYSRMFPASGAAGCRARRELVPGVVPRNTGKSKMKTIAKSAMAVVLLAGAAQADGLAGTTLRVGSDITSPPYIYFDDAKKPAGFDAEFVGLLAEAGGFSADFVDTRFENLILGLGADKFDIIASSMFIKPERAKQIDFIPYANAGLGLAARATAEFKPKTVLDLCGHRVGIIKGAAYIESIKSDCTAEGKAVDIREFPTSAEATQALMANNVEAQADDAAVLKVAVDKTGGRVEITSQGEIYPVVLGIGVSKAKPELKAELEADLQKIKDNGAYDALLAKYALTAPTDAQFKAAIGE